MPQKNMVYYGYKTSSQSTAYYYFENLDGNYLDADRIEIIAQGSNLGITKEDFVDFTGFTYHH